MLICKHIVKPHFKATVTNEKLDTKLKQTAADIVDTLLEGMNHLWKKVDARFSTIENDLTDMKWQLNDVKADTPTRKEFEEVKAKVNKHYPFS